MLVAALGFGFVIGGLLGLVGGGGSILAVPALVYGVGMPLAEAIPSSLVVVGASSAIAVLPRLGRDIHWPLAIIMGTTGGAVAFAGAALNRALDPHLLLVIFASIMVIAGTRMLWTPNAIGDPQAVSVGWNSWRGYLPRALLMGVIVGFLTGLLGVGGGFLIVPALALLLGLPMATAVGTSLVIVVINSLGGIASHTGHLDVDWALTAGFAATAMTSSYIGGRFARLLPERVLKRGFAVLVLVIAVYVVVMGFVQGQ